MDIPGRVVSGARTDAGAPRPTRKIAAAVRAAKATRLARDGHARTFGEGTHSPALRPAGVRRGGRCDPIASSSVTETQLTPETHARLVAELEDLTTRGRVEIARQIEAARALGDLSENGDYHAAKDAQGKMESRVRQLRRMLEDAVIVDASTPPRRRGDHRHSGRAPVRRGRRDGALPRRFDRGEGRRRVGGLARHRPSARLSSGASVGETVEYEAPNGKLAVEIVSVGL